MGFITYPLDNILFSAEDVELFNCPRTSGIYAEEDFVFSVTGADNTVTIGPGVGWIRNARFKGKVIAIKEESQIDVGLPDASYPRYDVIAIQFSANGNGTQLVVKSGTPASSPALPAITQTEAVYELYLCAILREVGATSVTAKDITDLRLNPAYCGLMADAITKIDTTAINAQIVALIEELRSQIAAVKSNSAYLLKSGDTLEGPMNANGHSITGLPTPTGNSQAVPLRLVKDLRRTMWTNSAPASVFAAQDLPFSNPANNQYATVFFCVSKDDSTIISSGKVPVPDVGGVWQYRVYVPWQMAASQTAFAYRTFKIARTDEYVVFQFEDAVRGGGATANDYLIPYRIDLHREVV